MTPAVVLAALVGAVASSSPSPSPSPLPPIASVRVATGSRQSLHALPVAAAALDRAAISGNAALTSDALLRSLPGFDRSRSNSMFTNYGQLRLSFAGAGTDRGLMLADGVPAQDGFGGQVDWAAYPPGTVQRAELLLGAGSALYGPGAVGGVLNVQTFAPPAAPRASGATLFFSGGTHAHSEQWLNAAATLTPRIGAAISLQQQRLEYDALPPAYSSAIDRPSQADAAMAQLRVRYAANSSDSIELGVLGAWDDQFEGRTNYTFSRRLSQTMLRYARDTAQSSLQAAAYARSGFVVNTADRFPAAPGALRYVQDVPVSEQGGSAMWMTGSPAFTISLRADARSIRGESDQYATHGVLQSSGSGFQRAGGLGAQAALRGARFEALAGARFDSTATFDQRIQGVRQNDLIAQAISPRVAFRYDLSPGTAVRISSGTGLRPPFLNELVRGFFIGAVSYEPNPGLVPERSITNSAGIDAVSPRSRLSLDAFATVVKDAIVFRTISATLARRENVGQTRTNGYVLSYARSVGTCSRVSAWASGQYARVTAGDSTIAGKRLPYVPAQSASLAYEGALGRMGIGLSASYLGQTYADDRNEQPLGTALLLGVNLRAPIPGGAALVLSAANVTGTRYLSSIDRFGPPAVISLGISLPIGLAPPRSACPV